MVARAGRENLLPPQPGQPKFLPVISVTSHNLPQPLHRYISGFIFVFTFSPFLKEEPHLEDHVAKIHHAPFFQSIRQ